MTKSSNKESVVVFSTIEKLLKENNFLDEEIRIIKASHDGMHFCNYKNRMSAIKDIGEELLLWLDFLGIKISEETKGDDLFKTNAVIADMIVDYFPALTKKDIQNAIKLSIVDKLPTDNKHYNNFSPIYVTRILNSYSQYKGGIILKYQGLLRDMEEEKRNRLTDEDKERIILQGTIYKFNEYKAKGDFVDYEGIAYDFLRKNGYIKLSDEQKDAIKEQAEIKLKTDAHDNSQSATMRKIIAKIMNDSRSYKRTMKVESKNIAVRNFFTQLIAEKKDIKDVIAKEIERIGV